ncbi:MAG: zinc ribbon domain-containing protein [Blautia sp.]|nr:zinc ribbon domain-containing protein [Blautia sp.]
MKMIKMVCPYCGAQLEIGEDRSMCYCSYCGSKILISDDENNITVRFENAKQAGYEFEKGRMEAQEEGHSNIELANTIKELIEPLEQRDLLEGRKQSLESSYNKLHTEQTKQSKRSKAGPVLTSVLFFFFLAAASSAMRSGLFALLAIVLPVLLYKLLKKKNLTEKEDLEKQIRLKEEEINLTRQHIEELNDSYDFSVVPEEYQYSEAIDFFYRALMTSKAYTMQQAVVLYEDYLKEEEKKLQEEERLRLQKQELEELRSLKESLKKENKKKKNSDTLDKALVIGSTLYAGATIIRELKKLSDK